MWHATTSPIDAMVAQNVTGKSTSSLVRPVSKKLQTNALARGEKRISQRALRVRVKTEWTFQVSSPPSLDPLNSRLLPSRHLCLYRLCTSSRHQSSSSPLSQMVGQCRPKYIRTPSSHMSSRCSIINYLFRPPVDPWERPHLSKWATRHILSLLFRTDTDSRWLIISTFHLGHPHTHNNNPNNTWDHMLL